MASNTWKVLLFSTFVLLVDLSAGQTLPDLSECGRSVGCFRNPPNCMTSDNCTSVVRWYKTNDSNYIGFDLMAVSDGWVAVGLSMDKSMGSDSVVRCIRNSSDNDAVSVSLGYNNGTYNYPYMPSNGMQYVNGQTGSYINGRVTCSFQRSIIGDNVGVYALNNSYYLLLGFGPANAGVLQPHMEYPQISPIMVSVVTDFQDVSNSIMVSDGSGSQATFTSIPGTNRVLIKMTSTAVGSSGWLGLGFSYDQVMANDSVIGCILMINGTLIVKHSYNNFHSNMDIPNAYDGITNAILSNTNGLLQCVFEREINGLRNSLIYSLDRPYYILIARGPVDDQGTKQYHSNHFVTPQTITVANSSSSSPMGYSYFSDDDGNSAAFRYLSNSSEIEFQITGPVSGTGRWIALGFSDDNQMGNDSVLDCILQRNGTTVVQHSYNYNDSTRNFALNSSAGIRVIGTSYQNGVFNCSFRRNVTGFTDQRIFSLDNLFYLLLARGPVSDDGIKLQHDKLPIASSNAVDLRLYGNVTRATIAPSTSGVSYFNDPNSGDAVQFMLSTNGAYVEFTIQRPSPTNGSGWVAVGFNDIGMMANSSIIDCILMSNGTFRVQLSYNRPINHSNEEIGNPDSAIIDIVTENANGIMKCNLKRKVSGFSDNRIFPFTKQYHLLLASGALRPDGQTKGYHFTTRVPSSTTFNLTSTEGQTSQEATTASTPPATPGWSSFNDPNSGDVVQFMLSTNGTYVEFTIQRPSPPGGSGWVAVGFNDNGVMANSSIIDCILMSNGTFRVQLSYNRPINHSNEEIGNPDSAIIDIVTENANGIMKCNLKRKVSGFSDNRIFPFTKQYHLLLASGALRPDGQTKGYHFTTRVPSSTTFNLTSTEGQTSQEATTASTPPATPGWSSFNDPNSGNTVQFMLSTNGTYVEFTIQGPSPPGGSGWVAVGFNDIGMMVNSSVIDCILTSNGTFKVQLSYNDPAGTVNEEIGNPDSAIIDVVTENANGIMKCNLKRKVSGFSDNRIFPFTKLYYLLLASGPLNPDGTKAYHMNKVPSKAPFNLTSTEGQNASETGCHTNSQRLLRAHGSLMITTFVMLMSGAIIVARYYKTCWPDDKICGTGVWFAVHRFLMVIGLFCCAAGFIIIFCYSSGFICRSFPSGSPSYYWVHGPLGIVVMCLIIINPIMALLRCDPDHHLRWIYNWLHFFVGMSCQILAGITLFFGIKMGELKYNLNHWSVFWILIAFVAFHVFIEFVLMIERLISQRFTKQSFTVSYGMSAIGEEPSAVKAGSGVASRESLVFRYCVLTLYTAVTMGLWLAMIIMIGGGFYTSSS